MLRRTTHILLFLGLMLCAMVVHGQFAYDTPSADPPTGDDLGEVVAPGDPGASDNPVVACSNTIGDIYEITAATVNTDDANLNQYIWVVYGGVITDYNEAAVSPTTAGVSGINYSYYIGTGTYDVGGNQNSSITITWDETVAYAWVAVQQINEWGCSDGLWAVFYVSVGDAVSPAIYQNPFTGVPADDVLFSDIDVIDNNLVIVLNNDPVLAEPLVMDLTSDFATRYDYLNDDFGGGTITFDQPSEGSVIPQFYDDCSLVVTYSFVGESGLVDVPVADHTNIDLSGLRYRYGTNTITWSATDGVNAVSTATQNIYIYDAADFDIVRDADWGVAELGCNPQETGLAAYNAGNLALDIDGDDEYDDDDTFPIGTAPTYDQPAGWTLISSDNTTLTGPDRAYNNSSCATYYFERTYTATWENDNNTSATFTRSETRRYTFYHDTEIPSLTVQPATITLSLDASGVATFTVANLYTDFSDNCDPSPSVLISSFGTLDGISETGGTYTVNCTNLGTHTLRLQATDNCGNQTPDDAAYDVQIEIIDNILPSIGPASVSVQRNTNVNDGGACRYLIDGVEFDLNWTSTSDNCSVVKLFYWISGATTVGSETEPIEINTDITNFTLDGTELLVTDATTPAGSTSAIHWKVEDQSGNQSATVTYTVEVIDNTAPFIPGCGETVYAAYDYGLTGSDPFPMPVTIPVDACNDITAYHYTIGIGGTEYSLFPLPTPPATVNINMANQGFRNTYWVAKDSKEHETPEDGCRRRIEVNLQPTLVIDASPNPTCYGYNDGSITITPTHHASETYDQMHYRVNGVTTSVAGTTASNLVGGEYEVWFTVTINGYTQVSTVEQVTLTDPEPITYTLDITSIDCPTTEAETLGKIILTIDGWGNYETDQTGDVEWTFPNETVESTTGVAVGGTVTIDELARGNYVLLLTNDRGCEITETIDLQYDNNTPPAFTSTPVPPISFNNDAGDCSYEFQADDLTTLMPEAEDAGCYVALYYRVVDSGDEEVIGWSLEEFYETYTAGDYGLAISSIVGKTLNVGTYTITWRAVGLAHLGLTMAQMEAATNKDYTDHSYAIQIIDNEAPQFTYPANIPDAVNDEDLCYATIAAANLALIGLSDNCIAPEDIDDIIISWQIFDSENEVDANGAGMMPETQFPVGVWRVVYTVTDLALAPNSTSTDINSETFFTVTVTDNQSPTITLAVGGDAYEFNTDNDGDGDCTYTFTVDEPTIWDNCAITLNWEITYNAAVITSGTGFVGEQTYSVGTSTIRYWLNDGYNAEVNESVTVTIIDNEVPTLTINTATVAANTSDDDLGNCTVAIEIDDVTFDDNCNPTLSWVMTGATEASGDEQVGNFTFNAGVTVITYTSSDGVNTNATGNVNVTVTDDEIPVAAGISINPTYLLNHTDVAEPALPGEVVVSGADLIDRALSTDNCTAAANLTGEIRLLVADPWSTQLTFDCNDLGAQTVFLRVRDEAGKYSTNEVSVTFTIADDEAPDISTLTAELTAEYSMDAGECYAIIPLEDLDISFTDNCPTSVVLSWVVDHASDDGRGTGNDGNYPTAHQFWPGESTVTYTITDGGGNTDDITFTITVVDEENPTLSVPEENYAANTSDEEDYNCSVEIAITNAVFDDNCSATLSWTMTGDTEDTGTGQIGDYTFNVGTTTITYIATDLFGNPSLEVTVEVIVTDDENPIAVAITDAFVAELDENGVVTVLAIAIDAGDLGALGSRDNCTLWDPLIKQISKTGGADPGEWHASLVYDCSEVAALQTVHFRVIDVATNISVVVEAKVDVQDNIAPDITDKVDIVDRAMDSGECFASLNTNDLAVAFDDNCKTYATLEWLIQHTGHADVTGSSPFDTDLNDFVYPTDHHFMVGTTTVTYTIYGQAEDPDDRSNASISFTVNVVDEEDPEVDNNAGFNHDGVYCYVENNDNATMIHNPTFTITDNCTVNTVAVALTGHTTVASATVTDNGDNTYTINESINLGATVVAWNITDLYGNSITHSYTLIFASKNGFALTMPADREADEYCNPTELQFSEDAYSLTIPSWLTDMRDADPSLASFTQNDGSNLQMPRPDAACNNSRTRNYWAQWVLTLNGGCELTIDIDDDQTYTYRDDNTNPEITTTASNLDILCVAGQDNSVAINAWLASHGGAVASDNCTTIDDSHWTNDYLPANFAGACAASGATLVTFTVTDECVNPNTTQAYINIFDNEAPVLAGIPANIEEADAVDCDAIPAVPVLWTDITATDNCSSDDSDGITIDFEETTTKTRDPATIGDYEYTITRTWTATDECGNESAPSVQTIAVRDQTAPVIGTDASDRTVECDGAGNLAEFADWLANYGNAVNGEAGATATDNCAPAGNLTWTNNSATQSWQDGTCNGIRFIEITFTVADVLSNSTNTSIVRFTIQDTQAPVVAGDLPDTGLPAGYDRPDNIPVALVTIAALEDAYTGFTVNDACLADADIVVTSEDIVNAYADGGCTYTVTRTYTFTDACENSSTAQQTFTVKDQIIPFITKDLVETALCAEDEADKYVANVPIGLTDEEISDNCAPDVDLAASIQYRLEHTTAGGAANQTTPVDTWVSGNPATLTFYEGVTDVIYRITDNNNNISVEVTAYTITVYHKPVPGTIAPGTDELAEGTYGGPNQPLRYSTHTYTIEIEDVDNFEASTWHIERSDARGTPIDVTHYTTSSSIGGNTVTLEVTFNRDMIETDYYLMFTEITGNNCSTAREYFFTLNAPFDVNITQVDDDCPDQSGDILDEADATTTVITYPIILESSSYAANWSFDFDITISETSGGTAATVSSITIENHSGNASLDYTVGALTGSVDITYNSVTPTTSFNLVVTYDDVHATVQEITMLLEEIRGQFGERDIDVILDEEAIAEGEPAVNVVSYNQTIHQIQYLPAPGNITGVE